MGEQPGTQMDTLRGQEVTENPLLEQTSTEYVRRWNRLVSTTNWEKGRIICHWRAALIEADAPPASYTDEAWSHRAGSVTPQHVGRLRRVYERFGQVCQQYAGLYWSHFQAALDWPDAEMWLQGAVENGWSVGRMRTRRWDAIGALPEMKPRPEDIITAELDEDAHAPDDHADQRAKEQSTRETISARVAEVRAAEAVECADSQARVQGADQPATIEPLPPPADLARLPPDLSRALKSCKLSILRHKLSGWQKVSCEDVVAALEALKQLALAPAED